jgi:Mn2+/Fe2+ NRAMP family transporter
MSTVDPTVQGAEHPQNWLKALGPGLLFAAASVGVSHLVQSTRAGALYGLSLVGVVILANVVKYPAFRFAPHYAAATGTSLLEGYRRQGRWCLVLYSALTLLTMFTIEAVVVVVTAGLAIAAFGLDVSATAMSAVLILSCLGLLALGHYRWLDRVTKLLVVGLSVSTLWATALVIPRLDFGAGIFPSVDQIDKSALFFIVALVGWMPSAIDISVWQSLWTVARREDTGHPPTVREATLDFHIGYYATVLFAVCFVMLGAGVMYKSGEQFESSAAKFAAQVIGLYTQTLGEWSRVLIAGSAFAVMFSTTLTVVDGFPRALATLVARFHGAESPQGLEVESGAARRNYWIFALLLGVGSVGLLSAFPASAFKMLVDVATTLSFLTAPVLAWLNHRAVLGAEIPEAKRPPGWLLVMSQICVLVLAAFALFYLFVRFGLEQ